MDSAKVDPYTMKLYKMHDFARSHGAVCLDGSPGAFYFRPATDPAHKNDWILHFKGAGWCYDKASCTDCAFLRRRIQTRAYALPCVYTTVPNPALF